ncbi:MAG: hypothetical protein KAX20_03735 [Candidatus Omnitrophica bacterium]|nr:hypothetical protein [Candidatus Omnitrophota bacterium]
MGRKKILTAVTIPKKDYFILEEISKKRKINRSALISSIIHRWLNSLEKERLIRQYEKGYRKHPEDPIHITALEKAEFKALSREGWK